MISEICEEKFTGENPTEDVLRLIGWTQKSLQSMREAGSTIPPEVDLMLGIQHGIYHNLVDAIVRRYEGELVELERVIVENFNDQ